MTSIASPQPPELTQPVPARGGAPSARDPRKRYPGSDQNDLHNALVFSGLLGRLPPALAWLLCAAGVALAAFAAMRVSGLSTWQWALPLAFGSLLFDGPVLLLLPRARISFGPFAPQLFLLAAMRAAVTLALALTARSFGLAWMPAAHALLQLAGCVLVLRAFVIEPRRLGVTHMALRADKREGTLRVMQVGDLHVERESVREDQLQAAIERYRPDLLLFTGDFLNLSCVHDRAAWAEVRRVLQRWHAPLGVYAVTGSPLVDPPGVAQELLAGLPITWLRNQAAAVGPVRLLGVTCTHVPEDDARTLDALLEVAPHPDLFTILLYHSPDLFPHVAQRGVDLQLSGHTHGGQVRLPFFGALLTSSLHGKRYEMGAYRERASTLYVARGTGLEGHGAPRARFLCAPEIVLWEIGI